MSSDEFDFDVERASGTPPSTGRGEGRSRLGFPHMQSVPVDDCYSDDKFQVDEVRRRTEM